MSDCVPLAAVGWAGAEEDAEGAWPSQAANTEMKARASKRCFMKGFLKFVLIMIRLEAFVAVQKTGVLSLVL